MATLPNPYLLPKRAIYFVMIALLGLLSACQTGPKANTPLSSPFTFVDSTLIFADRTASVSMRATFDRKDNSTMSQGYRFQFRSIQERPSFLSSISIIAGGKRLFLEEGQVVLPKEGGITLQLSLEDSQYVAQFPSALFQFRHNNESELFSIELHQLTEFAPSQ